MQTGSAEIHGVASDIATAEGCAATLEQALAALGGLDVLVNNAGAVRVGRRENTDEAELQAMIDVTAPILLTRAAPPVLHNSSDAMMVNVSSGIALVGAPFYETYATVTAGLAYFGEAPRRELKREGIHVLTVSSPAGRNSDDEVKPRRVRTWLYARTGLRRCRRHRGRHRNRGVRGDP